MSGRLIPALILVAFILPGLAHADELAQIIQQDLATLGYEPGNTDGEVTTQTIVAVSKFQAEHDLAVTGEITPQLAGVIKAAIRQQNEPAAASNAVAASAAPALDADALRAAQQACLQEKMAAAQEAQQRQRGLRSLARAVTRTASQFGNNDTSRQISRAASDVYSAGAIAGDLQSAAKDLGLTEDEVEQCRNPR